VLELVALPLIADPLADFALSIALHLLQVQLVEHHLVLTPFPCEFVGVFRSLVVDDSLVVDLLFLDVFVERAAGVGHEHGVHGRCLPVALGNLCLELIG
jgi:hypothetical protein